MVPVLQYDRQYDPAYHPEPDVPGMSSTLGTGLS
jgi:hypothetical protein